MGRINLYILGLFVLVATTKAQRNLAYPTTKQPAPAQPEASTQTSAVESTTLESTTPSEAAPYPAAGYRPGRAFNLPTEERKSPDSTYGPPTETPTEEPTTIDNAPYPPAGYRPGKAFNLPTEDQTEPESSYGPPTEQAPEAPYPPAGYRPGRAFNLPTEGGNNIDTPKSSYGPPDQSAAGTEIVTTIDFPESEFDEVPLARIRSGPPTFQARPGFNQPQQFVNHRFIRPGPNQRPIRPIHRPIGSAQSVIQTRPSFGVNSGFVYDREPVLVATIRLPDPFAFTSFLDDF